MSSTVGWHAQHHAVVKQDSSKIHRDRYSWSRVVEGNSQGHAAQDRLEAVILTRQSCPVDRNAGSDKAGMAGAQGCKSRLDRIARIHTHQLDRRPGDDEFSGTKLLATLRSMFDQPLH